MKKKLFVIVIALVLATSIVGASYALYVKTASKDVTIGSDPDAVQLSFGATALGSVVVTPSAATHTYDVTLTKSGAGTPAEGMQGFFKASLTDVSTGDLSEVLSLSAVVTHKDTTTENLDNDTLVGTGYSCALSDLPESVALTVTLTTSAPGFDYANYAEESVTIKLYWIPFDNTAYYLRSADTDWLPDPYMILIDNPDNDGDEIMIKGVTLTAGQQFKITRNGYWYNNVKEGEGNLAKYDSTSTNMYVDDAGTYDFYYSPSAGLWINAAE